MFHKLFVYLFFLTGLIISDCTPPIKISSQNLAHIYQNTFDEGAPDFLINHISEDSSTLYIQFKTNRDDSLNTRKYSITCLFYADFNERVPIDSFSVNKTMVDNHNTDGVKLISVNFYSKYKNTQLLKVCFTNPTTKRISTYYTLIDRSSINCSQYFTLKNHQKGSLIFNHFVDNGSVTISYFSPNTPLFITSYPHNTTASYPVYKPQKIFPINIHKSHFTKIKGEGNLHLQQTGIYYIKADTTINDGMLLLLFNKGFPKIKTVDDMVKTLRYITKNAEYNEMMTAPDKKPLLDKFWIKIGGNKDRAKVLIKEYYSRVWKANQFFTSFKEGWLTDRGMVYIIYGKPNIIYKNGNTENWIYNKTSTEPMISFYFNKEEAHFSNNHYILVRNPLYENSWNIAIHKWRHGRINGIMR